MNSKEEVIIKKIEHVHGDKYHRDQIRVIEGTRKIQLTCQKHGNFEIRLDHLLNGSGCQHCSKIEKAKRIKESEALAFPLKAKDVHGDRYDYSKVEYQDHMTRVIIICKKHGEFTQAPRKHIEGSGCQKCGVEQQENKINTEIFIDRSKKIHGDKYKYEQAVFINSKTKIKVQCELHGIFEILPHNHMKGVGCKKCADISNTKTTEDFIEQANNTHSGLYSYARVKYSGFKVQVDIICNKHGLFKISPSAQLRGKGCQKCSIELRAAKQAKNTISFIDHANLVHDKKWDYSKTHYVNTHTKVSIICHEHGAFEQTPASHLSGKGCPKCGFSSSIESRKLKFSDFLERSNITHEDRYIYDEKSFVSTHVPMTISCKKHGHFYQRPSSHMRGSGCPLCAYEQSELTKTKNTYVESIGEDVESQSLNEMKKLLFVKTANEIHNNFYDYSEVKMTSREDLIRINCPKHGFFEQKAEWHLYGSGCPRCRETERRIQTPEFIEKARIVHGDSYDYSKSQCNGNDSTVIIICKIHGEFEQTASGHLKGNRCRKCYVDSTKSNNEYFISKCREVHNNKYSYENTKYTTARSNVIITCKEHGDFVQVANDHKNGSGCPACAEYYRNLDNRDPESPCILYYIKFKFENTVFYKIGITTLSTKQRFRKAQQYNITLVEENQIETTLGSAIKAEQAILSEYYEYRFDANGILKDIGGGTECFSTNIMAKYNMELADYII